jgi:hypothetical protein
MDYYVICKRMVALGMPPISILARNPACGVMGNKGVRFKLVFIEILLANFTRAKGEITCQVGKF